MNVIPVSAVSFHPQSFGLDPNGRLFEFEGDLFRAINSQSAPLYRNLFEKGVIQKLVASGLLIDSEIAPFNLEGYEMVIGHKRVPFVSYPFEWSARMLQDAALSFLELSLELAKDGLTTQDANPWNILFAGYKPIYVDFCSIVPTDASGKQDPCRQFHPFFLYPLRLMSLGYSKMARWSLHDFFEGIPQEEFAAITRPNLIFAKIQVKRLLKKIGHVLPIPLRGKIKRQSQVLRERIRLYPSSQTDMLQRLKQQVKSMQFPTKHTDWLGYYDGCFPSFSPSCDWKAKRTGVFNVLNGLRPSSVLDIGSNIGWYSRLAASSGAQVVSLDRDESCIAQLYSEAKKNNLPILPLVMDFRNPSPGYGLCNKWFAPAAQRLKCDLVLALALVHHLVFKEGLNFDQISDALNIFSKKWLLVEFIPQDDQCVKEWQPREYTWYDLDNFCLALRKYFGRIEVMPSDPSPRKLLLCEK
jgi:SAM-dependent methyltransferase